MRVLHVINSLSASGGAEHGLVREATHFSDKIDQKVVRLFPGENLEPRLTDAGIATTSIGLSSSQSGWNWLLGAQKLTGPAREFRPDVIHTSLASSNLVGQIVGRRLDVPVVSTFTLSGAPELMRQYQPGAARARARMLRQVEGWSARGDNVWFRALTKDAAESNGRALGVDSSRISVIPRGVPIPSRRSPDRLALGIPKGPSVVLNVGRQTAQKGHIDLVSAFAALAAEVPVHLVIVGRQGDGTGDLHDAIDRHGVGELVTIVDYTEDPFAYYQAADVMLFPSFMEGLGTAVLEAMGSGLPVVAYDIPPVREIVGDSSYGYLVPTGDWDSLAECARHVLENPGEANELAARARQHVASNYSIEVVASRVEGLLMEVASSTAS